MNRAKRTVPWILTLVLALPMGAAGANSGFDYAPLDRVLDRFVDDRGRVDYAGLKAEPGALKAFLDRLARVSPESHPELFPERADRLAYWINAYNALVLKGAVEAYPIRSVKEVDGFFDRLQFPVGGRQYSLNEIEHGILREQFGEPRIHAALNCASEGCPKLQREAFRPGSLDRQLDAAMRTFIRDERHVQIDRVRKAVTLSKIFDWFGGDFTGWYEGAHGRKPAGIQDYLALYLEEEDRAFLRSVEDLKVRYRDYDWTLNDRAIHTDDKTVNE